MEKKKYTDKGNAVKGKDGKMIEDPEEIRTRWKEYVEELYRENSNLKEDKEVNEKEENQKRENEEKEGPGVLREEVLAAIEDMKNNKAEGIDNIPIEFLRNLGERAMEELVQLCQDIYKTGEWPDDFLQTIMIPLRKKQNATSCEEYRTISLLIHAS